MQIPEETLAKAIRDDTERQIVTLGLPEIIRSLRSDRVDDVVSVSHLAAYLIEKSMGVAHDE